MNLTRGIDLRKIAGMLTDASGAECKVEEWSVWDVGGVHGGRNVRHSGEADACHTGGL